MRYHDGQRGDIIFSWLVQMLAIMAVIGLLGYEVIAVVVTSVTLDDNAREVARVARDEYRRDGSLTRATAAAVETADTHGAEVTAVVRDGDALVVELAKTAPTLLVHRVGPLEDLAMTTASSTIRLAP